MHPPSGKLPSGCPASRPAPLLLEALEEADEEDELLDADDGPPVEDAVLAEELAVDNEDESDACEDEDVDELELPPEALVEDETLEEETLADAVEDDVPVELLAD